MTSGKPTPVCYGLQLEAKPDHKQKCEHKNLRPVKTGDHKYKEKKSLCLCRASFHVDLGGVMLPIMLVKLVKNRPLFKFGQWMARKQAHGLQVVHNNQHRNMNLVLELTASLVRNISHWSK